MIYKDFCNTSAILLFNLVSLDKLDLDLCNHFCIWQQDFKKLQVTGENNEHKLIIKWKKYLNAKF